jgi:hypothetical protein
MKKDERERSGETKFYHEVPGTKDDILRHLAKCNDAITTLGSRNIRGAYLEGERIYLDVVGLPEDILKAYAEYIALLYPDRKQKRLHNAKTIFRLREEDNQPKARTPLELMHLMPYNPDTSPLEPSIIRQITRARKT